MAENKLGKPAKTTILDQREVKVIVKQVDGGYQFIIDENNMLLIPNEQAKGIDRYILKKELEEMETKKLAPGPGTTALAVEKAYGDDTSKRSLFGEYVYVPRVGWRIKGTE